MSTPNLENKTLTLKDLKRELNSSLLHFYQDLLEPQFKRIDRLEESVADLRQTMNDRFDDLCKKYEDLHQKYLVMNHQLKGIDLPLEFRRNGRPFILHG